MDEMQRFFSKVDVRGKNDCWVWTGGLSEKGYGIWYSKGKHYATRWLLGQLRGKPLLWTYVGEEEACHTCDNPPCVNPRHLYVGTRGDNVADAVERKLHGSSKKTRCPQGHPYDEVNTEYRKSGARRCKTCSRAAQHRRQKATMFCKNGHLLTGENVFIRRDGTRQCQACVVHKRALRMARPSMPIAASA